MAPSLRSSLRMGDATVCDDREDGGKPPCARPRCRARRFLLGRAKRRSSLQLVFAAWKFWTGGQRERVPPVDEEAFASAVYGSVVAALVALENGTRFGIPPAVAAAAAACTSDSL